MNENAETQQEYFGKAKEGKVVEHFEAYGQCRDSRRIAELEAENERLTVSYETLKLHDEEEIGMLKSENAELKDYRLTTLAKQQTGMSKYALNLEHKLSWYDDQLTKAKEIIKYLLSFIQKENYKTRWDINIAEAEQFLNEVDK